MTVAGADRETGGFRGGGRLKAREWTPWTRLHGTTAKNKNTAKMTRCTMP
jgi:hypothetical protein